MDFTPGPWEQDGMRGTTVRAGARVIASCDGGQSAPANARLIASAPDLLEALETVATAAAVDGWPAGWGLVAEHVVKAIAKAVSQ